MVSIDTQIRNTILGRYPEEFLALLIAGGNLIYVPTNAGWGVVTVPTGVTNHGLGRAYVATGVGVNSSAKMRAALFGLSTGHTVDSQTDWDKKLFLTFGLARWHSDAQCIARVQLKRNDVVGDLTDLGIGLYVANYALYGESYGTGRAALDLSTVMTDRYTYLITIVHTPGESVKWYVNGILVGTQTTPANIPSGNGGGPLLITTIENGAAGGVDCMSYLMQPKIWRPI